MKFFILTVSFIVVSQAVYPDPPELQWIHGNPQVQSDEDIENTFNSFFVDPLDDHPISNSLHQNQPSASKDSLPVFIGPSFDSSHFGGLSGPSYHGNHDILGYQGEYMAPVQDGAGQRDNFDITPSFMEFPTVKSGYDVDDDTDLNLILNGPEFDAPLDELDAWLLKNQEPEELQNAFVNAVATNEFDDDDKHLEHVDILPTSNNVQMEGRIENVMQKSSPRLLRSASSVRSSMKSSGSKRHFPQSQRSNKMMKNTEVSDTDDDYDDDRGESYHTEDESSVPRSITKTKKALLVNREKSRTSMRKQRATLNSKLDKVALELGIPLSSAKLEKLTQTAKILSEYKGKTFPGLPSYDDGTKPSSRAERMNKKKRTHTRQDAWLYFYIKGLLDGTNEVADIYGKMIKLKQAPILDEILDYLRIRNY